MKSYEIETQQEVQSLLNAGMIIASPSDIKQLLSDIGYTIEHDFNYVNTLNATHYNAKAVKIRDSKGYSFSNKNSVNKDNLKTLQEIRRDFFVYHNNRIWEL